MIFEPAPPSKRKVVVATNIAETFLTIESSLYIPEKYYRFYTKSAFRNEMSPVITLEIQRIDLAYPTLTLMPWELEIYILLILWIRLLFRPSFML